MTPLSSNRAKPPKEEKKKKKKRMEQEEGVGEDEDIVEDLVLSSDEDGSLSASPSTGEDDKELRKRAGYMRQRSKKQKLKKL